MSDSLKLELTAVRVVATSVLYIKELINTSYIILLFQLESLINFENKKGVLQVKINEK